MKVIVESPFKNENDVIRNENLIYLNVVARRLAMQDGHNPLFFHSFFTQFLDDDISIERDLGLNLSFVHHTDSECKMVAIDRGISYGMELGIKDAIRKKMPVYFYTLCDKNSSTYKEFSDINSIEDNAIRVQSALNLVNSFTPINSLGDLTDYREFCEEDTEVVKKVISNFFTPLVDYIN